MRIASWSYSLQWKRFHRWPLAVMCLLGQPDGKIHVVPFEICSCAMPAEHNIVRVKRHHPVLAHWQKHTSLLADPGLVFLPDII